ncbi:MAG: non-hydrolyzing UDP-N-acetylglucosamine 2-epimerase [Anaerolineae bacterium]
MPRPKIITVVGTRPELIKFSPVIPLLAEAFEHRLVHSGQHYSYAMDALFFEELRLPVPDYRLEVGSASHAVQTARILERIEPVLLDEAPSAVLALGDTNTVLAAMLAAVKLHIPAVHLEAGCRSFNRAMPEEINRVVADHVAAWCFAPGDRERAHLQAEGIAESRIRVVGSTAIDACLRNAPLAADRILVQQLGLEADAYVLLTLHRAENTVPETLRGILEAINALAETWPFVFPIHPRTRAVWEALMPPLALHPQIHVIDPVGYLDILHLAQHARAVMTDSGGLQEEAATLGTPLLIARQETEWAYLVDAGAAVVVGNTREALLATVPVLLQQGRAAFKPVDVTPQRGAAGRIVDALKWIDDGAIQVP